jgi:hypothetical protein
VVRIDPAAVPLLAQLLRQGGLKALEVEAQLAVRLVRQDPDLWWWELTTVVEAATVHPPYAEVEVLPPGVIANQRPFRLTEAKYQDASLEHLPEQGSLTEKL